METYTEMSFFKYKMLFSQVYPLCNFQKMHSNKSEKILISEMQFLKSVILLDLYFQLLGFTVVSICACACQYFLLFWILHGVC